MRSENTTKCVLTELHNYLVDTPIPAEERCRGETQGSWPMARQVGEHRSDGKPRHRSRGGSEARTAYEVGITPYRRLGPIVGRSLEGIWKRYQVLFGKGKLARFLDRMQDSNAIAKLAEELRQAILIYQVVRSLNVEMDWVMLILSG